MFDDEPCPECRSEDVDKEHNLLNLAVGIPIGVVTGVLFYFLDVPFSPNYECNECGNEWEGDCFVATEVYGENAPQVQRLREIRDRVLPKTAIGRGIRDFYYSGAGERTASFIRDHLPSAIPVIRTSLDYVVEHFKPRYERPL